MPDRKPFLIRIDPALLDALQRWAADEMRSLNGQIEYCLRNSLKKAGREINIDNGYSQ
ncbi:MAG: hypothetical protein LBB40_04765 [Holophagales bacterium]|jgi:hypothetical protein|nr:hypothetical protein [Holophagales bacterium]